MKAFILTAGQEDSSSNPSGIMVSKNVTLLENQVNTLLLRGFKVNEIFLVINKKSLTSIENDKNSLGKSDVNLILVENTKNRSLETVCQLNDGQYLYDDSLILNGDTFFDLNDIERLTNSPTQPKILVEIRHNRNTAGLQILRNQKIDLHDGVKKKSDMVPWHCYSGGTYLPKDKLLPALVTCNNYRNESISYLEFFSSIREIKFDKVIRQNKRSGQALSQSQDLIGGSFAGLYESNTVRKSAENEGVQKLNREIQWLRNLDFNLQKHFTKVESFSCNEDSSWYTMPKYDYDSMRKLLITGLLTPAECAQKLENIMDYLFENLYCKHSGEAPDNWVEINHFGRFYSRFSEVKNHPILKKIFDLDTLYIDGVEYKNLKSLVDELQAKTQKTSVFKPQGLIQIHGDLHLQNILVDINSDDFILVDPRGELVGSDIYYDLGKLWHSVNGLYDLIHTDISSFYESVSGGQAEFISTYGPGSVLKNYDVLRSNLYNLLEERMSSVDSGWYLKMLFNEAMHFSSLFVFHLKGDRKEVRAIMLYVTAVRLLTELLEQMEG